MSLGTFRRRPIRRSWVLVSLVPIIGAAALVLVLAAAAGPIGTASGFEDDDGNLAVNTTFDWNGFSPVTWAGTAPSQTASKTASGWAFTGLTDAQATSSDSGFGGGTKQDANCASVIGTKSPNKDDLKRIYLSSKTVSGHVYLNLAWMRIPQNTVNASAHVGFEFNQGTTACGAGSDGLVQRKAGDMLIVYDFEGSSAGAATLTVRRWVTSGACDIGSDSPPCWGVAQDLTASGFAEAKVNEVSVSDTVAPAADTLQTAEFGEAGIDLTAAGIFQPNVCTAFGQAEGVSRSSGNSGNAAMEDLVGPGKINLSNCGEVIIKKRTDPRGINRNFSYTSTLSGGQLSCTQSTPTSFTLNDNTNSSADSAANTQDCTSVPIGSSTVTESAQPGFTLESLTCTATGNSSGAQDGTNKFKANITIAAGLDVVTCVYVNQQNTASLATQVSNAGPVFPTAPVHDTATVTGNQASLTPSGTVTFFLCSGVCTSGGTNVGTGTLSGSGATASATSPDVNTAANPLAPGTWCFRAEWPGDTNYPAALSEFGGANGTNECFTVQKIKTTTVTTPSVGSGGIATFGSSVTDHALVTAAQGGGGTPTGTVTFFVCNPTQTSGGACPDPNGTQVGNAVTTQAVTGSSPPASSADSDAKTVDKTGTWCWRAVFTPGGANGSNYTGSSDASTGECFTVTDTTSITSAQDWLPNDTATVAPSNGAPLNGSLSEQLFTDNACGAGTGSAVNGQSYSKTLTDATSAADRTLTTGNTTYKVTANAKTSWQVVFTSSDPNVSSFTTCESSTLTIAN